jgi:hypothetical protein
LIKIADESDEAAAEEVSTTERFRFAPDASSLEEFEALESSVEQGILDRRMIPQECLDAQKQIEHLKSHAKKYEWLTREINENIYKGNTTAVVVNAFETQRSKGEYLETNIDEYMAAEQSKIVNLETIAAEALVQLKELKLVKPVEEAVEEALPLKLHKLNSSECVVLSTISDSRVPQVHELVSVYIKKKDFKT